MKEEVKRLIYRKLKACMENLVGGSGHLTCFHMGRDSFEITGAETLEGGRTRYYFQVEGSYESEFIVYDEGYEEKTETLEGSLVLDKDSNYVRDETGRILIEPWKCLDPERFASQDHDSRGSLDSLVDEVFKDKDSEDTDRSGGKQ